MRKILYHPFFIRLFNWEYWPFHVVYLPVYFYWCWLFLRARSFFFFNMANPGITNGGFLMESKKAIYDLLPEGSYPPTVFVKQGTNEDDIATILQERQFRYPLICKPDIGMQGLSVQKVNDSSALFTYARSSKVDFLIQEFIPYPKEAGIFYYRYPGQEKGVVSGIVSKEFLSVTGDGKSTVLELIQKEKRYILQMKKLVKAYGEELQQLLPSGEEKILVPYGNHVRGAKFIDASHLADESLIKIIDGLCSQVKGFYYGRLDIRYNTWEELKEGKNFSVIELNGAGSEPTHIYDPSHSLFFAWKEIFRHLNIMFAISRQNRRLLKQPYMSVQDGLRMFRENKQYIKLINGSQS